MPPAARHPPASPLWMYVDVHAPGCSTMSVRSCSSRILRQLSWYRGLTDESAQAMGGLESLTLAEDEHYLGIYENVPGDTRDGVVVTDKGLHVDHGGAWEFISYADISLVEVLQPKTEAT